MARPQNEVNGSITQPHLSFIPHTFNMNAQDPRNQSIYGYSDMPQVHYASQAYTSPINHNGVNSIRPISPMIGQPQYTIFQYSNPPYSQSQFNQYQFTQNFMPQSNFGYQQDNTNQTPAPPNPTRKCSPLVIVDPKDNTDLDLSKYKIPTSKENKNKNEIPQTLLVSNEATNLSEQIDEVTKKIEEIETKEETIKVEIIKEKIIKEETIIPEAQETVAFAEEKIKCLDTNESNEEKPKVEPLLLESVEEEEEDSSPLGGNNDEDGYVLEQEKNPSNYFLPVNKKDSDETVLRKKLIYDREYLITIKSNYLSQVKPINLPTKCDFSEEIIYTESQNISCKKPQTSLPTAGNNVKRQASKFQRQHFGKHHKVPPTKHIHLNDTETTVLERSKSSYLPPQLRTKDTDASSELKRNIKCNLNKITPQNFQDCLSEISKLNIKEKEEMSCLINEIFIKAVQEEAYSVTYAQFCNKLSEMFTESQTFKAQLLKKCQEMFQTPIQEQLDNVRMEWMQKIENEADPRMKNLYETDLEEQVKKAKDRYFGNIRFIGELFLHHLLAGKVILGCICELLKGKCDTDALLALCKLLETCGKQIDQRHKDQMNAFMRTMDALSKSTELETRMRFKLKDVIDMRKRDWALRHIQQSKKINPQTIEEQKEEALAEAALASAKSLASHKKSHHHVQNNAVRRQISAPQRPISFKNLSCTSHVLDETTILGPARSNWSSGSGLKSKLRNVESFTPTPQGLGANPQLREASPHAKWTNRYRTLESSAEASGTDSRSSSPSIVRPAAITKAYRIRTEVKPAMTDDERADIIFNDLISVGTFDTASWKQIRNPEPIVGKLIDDMMEKGVTCRQSIGDKFSLLIGSNLLSHKQLIDGSQAFLSCIDDLICDIPKLWEFFSQFLERFITDKNSNISFFWGMFQKLLPSDDVALCISMTLHAASSRLGHNIVGQVFHKSALKWEQIVRGNVESFVKENGLTFTIVGGAPLSSFGGCSLASIAEELDQMFVMEVSNEQIFDFMEEHIDKPTWKSRECTRTITGCILRAIKGKPKSKVREYLKDKSEVIKLVSQNKIENEVEVLTSVSNAVDPVDMELLTIIYDVIMTGKVVSNEAFNVYLEDLSLTSEKYFQIISKLYIPDD